MAPLHLACMAPSLCIILDICHDAQSNPFALDNQLHVPRDGVPPPFLTSKKAILRYEKSRMVKLFQHDSEQRTDQISYLKGYSDIRDENYSEMLYEGNFSKMKKIYNKSTKSIKDCTQELEEIDPNTDTSINELSIRYLSMQGQFFKNKFDQKYQKKDQILSTKTTQVSSYQVNSTNVEEWVKKFNTKIALLLNELDIKKLKILENFESSKSHFFPHIQPVLEYNNIFCSITKLIVTFKAAIRRDVCYIEGSEIFKKLLENIFFIFNLETSLKSHKNNYSTPFVAYILEKLIILARGTLERIFSFRKILKIQTRNLVASYFQNPENLVEPTQDQKFNHTILASKGNTKIFLIFFSFLRYQFISILIKEYDPGINNKLLVGFYVDLEAQKGQQHRSKKNKIFQLKGK